MVYYTQLLYTKDGHSRTLGKFEDATLPILERHGGTVLCRTKMDADDEANNPSGADELHLLSFPAVENFKNYMTDPERQAMIEQKTSSVRKVLLVEGYEITPS